MSSNDVKLKLQNIMIEREKNVKMEPEKVVRFREWLEKNRRCTELERSRPEEKLVKRIGEEVDKRSLGMEEEIEKLRREKLEVEEKLGKSERRCAELDKRIIEMEAKIEKLDVEEKMEKRCRELKQNEIVVEEPLQENNELRATPASILAECGTGSFHGNTYIHSGEKKMDAAQLYRTRMLKVEAKLANSGGSGGIGLPVRGGRKTAYNSGFAGSKGTVKDDLGKKPEVRCASYPASVNSRCTFRIINNIRSNLHEENLEKFEKSCFGHLLKINKFNFQGELMLQLLLRMDMVVSNEERLVFNINNSNIEFGPNDFDLITGLHFGTSEAIMTLSLSSIYEYVCQGRTSVSLTDLKEAFLTASHDNDGRGELTLKLALLYCLYGVVLPRNGHIYISKSELQYFSLIEDLQKFNAFSWGCVAYRLLVKSILSIRCRMDGVKVIHKPKYFLHGFSFALLTWAYEVMPSLATYCASRAKNFNNLTPRILCWSVTKRVRFNCLNKFFTVDDKAHLVLHSTQTSPEKTITKVKCSAPLSRPQPKTSKLVCRKDQMSSTGPTYPMHRPDRNILRMELDELRVEKRKSDEHYRKRLEDLETRLQESAAYISAGEEKIVILADGNAQYGNSMSAEGCATCDNFDGSGGNGLSKKVMGASLTRSDSEVPNPTRKMAASEDVTVSIGVSDGECMDMAFGQTIKRNIAEYCGEDSLINWTTKKKRSKANAPSPSPAAADCDSEYPLQTLTAADDVDFTGSSDDESCSDAYMSNLAMLQSKMMDV